MIRRSFLALGCAALFLAGCAHDRSTGYQRRDFDARRALKGHAASGSELQDTDVFGSAAAKPTEEEIAKALDRSSKVELRAGDGVLVVQSGKTVPDPRMVAELNKHCRAIPFSGVRSDWISGDAGDNPDYARALRMAAAQAGAQKILCFWGSLEVARHDLSTKTITWLPVIDVLVPDQKDRLRMQLKTAVVDVRTGAWTLSRTEPLEDEAITTGWGREHLESPEVRRLQQKSYTLAVNSLVSAK